jgi:heme/copper-type cytochrome/quinol oxidase subunit 4
MKEEIEYWKELMAVFRHARGHYAQIVSFSLASIIAATALAYGMTEGIEQIAMYVVITLAAGGATFMHFIFLKELNALQKQMLKVQPKIDDDNFDVTLATKNTLLASSKIFIIISIGLLFLTLLAVRSLACLG